MPQRIRKLRFPDGDAEFRTTEVHLKVGTIIRSRGKNWRIASVTEGLAVLEGPITVGEGASPVSDQLPADAMLQPGTTGDEPMVLEAIAVM